MTLYNAKKTENNESKIVHIEPPLEYFVSNQVPK